MLILEKTLSKRNGLYHAWVFMVILNKETNMTITTRTSTWCEEFEEDIDNIKNKDKTKDDNIN